jgi:hypothetical protein
VFQECYHQQSCRLFLERASELVSIIRDGLYTSHIRLFCYNLTGVPNQKIRHAQHQKVQGLDNIMVPPQMLWYVKVKKHFLINMVLDNLCLHCSCSPCHMTTAVSKQVEVSLLPFWSSFNVADTNCVPQFNFPLFWPPSIYTSRCTVVQTRLIAIKTNSVSWVRERPPLVGEVSVNFCGCRVSRGQRNGSPLPYSGISRPEPVLFLSM